MASDDNEQAAGRRFFKPYGWDNRNRPAEAAPAARHSTEDSFEAGALGAREGKPDEPPGDLHFPPGAEKDLEQLIADASAALVRVLSDRNVHKTETKNALGWLKAHPHALKMLLRPEPWVVSGGEPRPFRTRGSLWNRRPALAPEDVRTNQILFGEILTWLMDELAAETQIARHLAPLPAMVLRAFGEAYLVHLEAMAEGPGQGNPFLPWEALDTAKRWQLPIPNWALNALQDRAAAILAISRERPPHVAKAVSQALGFTLEKNKGPNPALNEREKLRKYIRTYAALAARHGAKEAVGKTVEAAASELGKDEEWVGTARRAIRLMLTRRERSF